MNSNEKARRAKIKSDIVAAAACKRDLPVGSPEWNSCVEKERAGYKQLIDIEKKDQANGLAFLCILAVVGVVMLIVHFTPADKPLTVVRTTAATGTAVAEPWRDAAWADEMQKRVAARLKDPASATFRNVATHHSGPAPTVCGEVNAKNGFGGYTGFERFVAAGDLVFLDSEMEPGAMSGVYAKVCQ